MTPPHAGLYIHIPFCIKKCAYCDFYSTADLSLRHDFLDGLFREMELLGSRPFAFDTIYLGGGTPSVLPPQSVELLITKAFSQFDIHSNAEITIEVNPGTVDINHLQAYRQTGINRINIGVQSFSDNSLGFLGRIHTKDEAVAAISAARQAGFDNMGLDLIYGLPGQEPEAWQIDLEQAISFSPEHLSCYSLTYEENTPLGKMMTEGKVEPLGDDAVADLFKIMQGILGKQGYEQYEIANFARMYPEDNSPGNSQSYRSQHNQKYWTSAPYIGLGPSAHSFVEPVRSWNVADIQTYLSRLEKGILPMEKSETLTDEQRLTETLYLSLRTREGIDVPRLEKTFGLDFHGRYGEALDDLVMREMLELTETRCSLTPKGMRFLDGIVALLVRQ